jgi:ABC-type molybdate transport system substrate-binding protein
MTKPTVTDLVSDLQVGSLDAAVLWDGNAALMPGFIAVQSPQLAALGVAVTIGVTATSAHSAAALRFARWLASPEHGAPAWASAGYHPLPGDAWAVRPVLTLYSGSVNRLPLEGLLARFAEREGVEITTVYNGCGILCADMKQLAATRGGAVPDAYYACDLCFVPPVADLYPEAVIVTETDIVLAVPRGDPKGIHTLADLARPGLTVGICNAEQSTLGYMTKRLLAGSGAEAAIRANVRSEVPTGDLLINQLRTGTLDAAIVYEVNVKPQAEHLDWHALERAGAKAIQPFAVGAKSPRAQLARRLLQRILGSREAFTDKGFRWRGDTPPIASSSIDPDPAARDRP